MLTDIIKGIFESEEDFELVGEVSENDALLEAVIEALADVIVVGQLGAPESHNYRDLLYARPRIKIIAIGADGRQAILHELQHQLIPIGDVSPASLITAIRVAARPDEKDATS
jgi:DNA-binding NarL/FixJ family response regulator